MKKYKENPIFISLDIDAFSSLEAPGRSQSWPLGFSSQDFIPGFKKFLHSFSVGGLGIYEVSPPLDINLNTQRLAAVIAYNYFTEQFRKRSKK